MHDSTDLKAFLHLVYEEGCLLFIFLGSFTSLCFIPQFVKLCSLEWRLVQHFMSPLNVGTSFRDLLPKNHWCEKILGG